MANPLNLFRLQQTDSQIDQVQSRLQSIKAAMSDDSNHQIADEKNKKAREFYLAADEKLKLAEEEAKNQRIKIEQTEASLYQGKGHSPKELQDLQNDVVALKKHLAITEESQLDAMIGVEEAEKLYKNSQSLLESENTVTNKNNEGLQAEVDALSRELQKLLSERTASLDSLSQDIIQLYDRIRKEHRGVAVATVTDKACSACGVGLSPAQIQASHTTQIMLCPSCGRILYGK